MADHPKTIQNEKDPRVRSAYGKLAGMLGIAGNLILFAAKLVIGVVSGAVSVMADAVNNLSDAASSLVTLIGFHMAARPADREHPYGHARMEYFAGLAVAVIILVLGVELAVTSVKKILAPEPVVFSGVLLAVLGLSILVKAAMAVFYTRMGRKIGSIALVATGADSRNDVIATGAVLLSCVIERVTGLPVDGYMGVLVAVFILISGVTLAKETMDPLLGAAPDTELVGSITELLRSHPAVLDIHDLMIHDYGPGRKFATVHVEMDCRRDVLDAHEVLDDLERRCMAEQNVLLTVHYDPVVTDDEVLNRFRARVERAASAIDARLSIHDFRMVRGQTSANLIFDLVLPGELMSRREEIRQEIEESLPVDNGFVCRTVVQFEEDFFNPSECGRSAADFTQTS